jgi:hypothetical protein
MAKFMRIARIFIKYLRKFLASIVSIIAMVRMNFINYPFSKEFKAINQDFISIGDDIKLIINKKEYKNEQKTRK